MEKTICLYDEDAYLRRFSARVLDCRKGEGAYEVILDRTAFFPQQGGQVSDTGSLNDAFISDVQIKDGVIIHYADQPLAVGSQAEGKIDWSRRFDLMQNHTGEHILSGIICNLFHCNNVGFRLAADNCTVDYDLPLTAEQLREAERRANQAIWENRQIRISYPSDEQLACLDYRSKKELSGRIRIVEIDGVDICACCAPHVHQSGEVGLLKIMSVEKHRRDVRLYILCGQRALAALSESLDITGELMHMLSTRRPLLTERVAEMSRSIDQLSQKLSRNKVELLRQQAAVANEDPVLLFCQDVLDKDLREVLNDLMAANANRTAGGFSGSDEQGYRCVIGRLNGGMRKLAGQLRECLGFQGGGSEQMIQGSLPATRQQIETTLSELLSQKDC